MNLGKILLPKSTLWHETHSKVKYKNILAIHFSENFMPRLSYREFYNLIFRWLVLDLEISKKSTSDSANFVLRGIKFSDYRIGSNPNKQKGAK